MTWSSWGAFWAMGGDGLYVWSAYLVAIVVIATEIAVLALSRRSILEHLGRFTRINRKPRNPPADETHT
ncbi:heme exporter protein CcmD [Aromatoleum diolicum]|uniref:Heme exporter protein D n=1 Tax=Aromatoleum diolicum TaxID=75796 RepID=A0ABX1QF96_9RHOO|nr:heme exporter protein CcmD [Aromatoleum diolicum]NMG75730.1 heme exporter protein CcmD [Aromatoleum diolicum]